MDSGPDTLRSVLLDPVEAAAMKAPAEDRRRGADPDLRHPEQPGLVFTERRADLRRHAGEISFPGGRQDDPAET